MVQSVANAVLFVLGIGLLAHAEPRQRQETRPHPLPAPLPAPAEAPPAAAPLPAPPQDKGPASSGDLDLPGLPGREPQRPAPSPPQPVPASLHEAPTLRPGPVSAAEPKRPPAFRILTPLTRQEAPAPPAAPAAKPAVTPPRSAPGATTPALSVEKLGPASIQAGQPFTYEIVVRNVGTMPAHGVRVDDQVPHPATRVLAAEPTPGLLETGLTWTLDSLPPGQEQRIRVKAVVTAAPEWGGSATVNVSASAGLRAPVAAAAEKFAAGPDKNGNQPPRPASAQLVLSMKGPASATIGQAVDFDVQVTNAGSTPLTNLVLRDALPAGLEHVYGSDIETGFDGLKPGESKTLKLELIAARAGRHVNELTVEAGEGQQASARAAVVVTDDASLALRLVGPAEAAPGRESDYQIQVTNRDRVEARNVTVTLQVPEGFAFAGPLAGVVYDSPTRTARWALAALPPGETRALQLRLQARGQEPALAVIVARTERAREVKYHAILRVGPAGQPAKAAANR